MKTILSILLITVFFIQAADYASIVKKYRPYIVRIEYFESIQIPEYPSGHTVKRSLTGVLYGDDGMIVTASSIFKAGLDFTNAGGYGPSEPPKDITVRFFDGTEAPARFVGKDDDFNLGFIQLDSLKRREGCRFVTTYDAKTGAVLKVLHLLPSGFQGLPFLQQVMLNARQDGLRPYFLADGKSIGMKIGLALDARNRPVGVAANESGFIQIRLASTFGQLLKNPPLYTPQGSDGKKWLGITMQPFTRAMARYFHADSIRGVLVNDVLEGSPAQQAGLQIGDVLLRLGDITLQAERYDDLKSFRDHLRAFPSDSAIIHYWRDGKTASTRVHLTATPISRFLAESFRDTLYGFSAKELTRDILLAGNLDFDTQGAWVSTVENAGWADLAGLQRGDIILAVNDTPVKNIKHLKRCVAELNKTHPAYVRMFIRRGSERLFIFIKTKYMGKRTPK